MAGPVDFQAFAVSARACHADVLVIASGELDVACESAVAAAVADAVTPQCRHVVIDTSAVTFIDWTGLRALVAPPLGWEGEWEVVLRAPSRPVRRLLQVTQKCGMFEVNWLDGNQATLPSMAWETGA
jgi:anti-anti-sigma factor